MRFEADSRDKLTLTAREQYEPLYENSGFTSGVAGFLSGMLPRVEKVLDDEDRKHLLLFDCGSLIDFAAGVVRKATPEDRLQRHVPRNLEVGGGHSLGSPAPQNDSCHACHSRHPCDGGPGEPG